MILRDTVTLLSKQKQQMHRKRMLREVLEILIAMVSGLAVGLVVISCFAKKCERRQLKKRSAETVKEDIESGYEDFKQGAQEVTDKISSLCDKTPD